MPAPPKSGLGGRFAAAAGATGGGATATGGIESFALEGKGIGAPIGALASASARSASTLSPSMLESSFFGRSLPMSFVSSASVFASGGGGVGLSPAIALSSRAICLSSCALDTPNESRRLSTSSPPKRDGPAPSGLASEMATAAASRFGGGGGSGAGGADPGFTGGGGSGAGGGRGDAPAGERGRGSGAFGGSDSTAASSAELLSTAFMLEASSLS